MKQYSNVNELSQFDKTMAILVGLSPHTFCHEDWFKTKELVWKIIYPLFGKYFLIKKNNKGYFLDTILDELSSQDVVSDSQILRIVNGENMGIVFEPDNHYLNINKKRYNTAPGIGIIKSKIFKKDYKPDNNTVFNNYKDFSSYFSSYDVCFSNTSFEYLLKMHHALQQEDKNTLIEINKKAISKIESGVSIPMELYDFENYEIRSFLLTNIKSKNPEKSFSTYNQETTDLIIYFRKEILIPKLIKMLDEIK